ncbi:MAG: pirin family protein [Candidatus Kapabacteria bacterium]|nr:pirin family protein [Candidatus Kapabacteria bacterium]
MKLHKASDRGHFDFGWLNTNHSFSFGHYMNEERMNFGTLRVLNDDIVAPGEGFGTHPHNNMEIISIPLEGVIMHRDSMGHEQGLRPGDVQVMSAGTGLTHSEYNGSATDFLKFLQIWIVPNERNVEPRYDQVHLGEKANNTLYTVVGPKNGDAPLWITQNAWLSVSKLTSNTTVTYKAHGDATGMYVFVIDGSIKIDNTVVGSRDAISITDTTTLDIAADGDAYFIVIEVPLV